MTSAAPPTFLLSRPKLAGSVVVLLHLVVAGLLWRMPAWGERQAAAPAQPPLLVRLWWAQAPAQAAEPLARADRPRLPAPATPAPSLSAVAQAISDPATVAAEVDAAAGAPALATQAPATRAEPTAPTPLNLNLPRGASAPWRQRNPALDDPRSNTAKLTLEQKLANAMGGDGTWVMERVDLNTIRYRRGNECVQMIRSRAGQLELGGGAFRNSWLARDC